MLQLISILPLFCLLHHSTAAPSPTLLTRQDTGCSAYTIINTRGITEPQAESSGFITMNKAIRSAIPGVETYNTVYPADSSQTSSIGTDDIIARITSVLSTDPGHCFALEGYSQGAKSTVQALPSLTGAMFDAIKAVFLIGNPYHKAGLACKVDIDGGESTLNVDGKSLTADNAIPDNWVEKTMDVCNKGDGVCDTTNGQKEITDEHTAYQGNTKTQNLAADFVIKAFNAISTSVPSSTGTDGSISASAPTSTTAIEAGSSSDSIKSTSSQGTVESLPTHSSDLPPALASEISPDSVSGLESIPTSVMAPIESGPAPSSSSSSVVESAFPTAQIAESSKSQSSRPARTRCQPRPSRA